LSAILYKPNPSSLGRLGGALYNSEKQDHELENVLDWKLLAAAKSSLEKKEKTAASFNIKNTNRTVGTIFSNEITKLYKAAGLPDNTIHFKFNGTAGQSFGAFNTKGITLELEGDANDYFGKGLSGARLIVYPSADANFAAEENIIIGNVAFYGATSGHAFIRGKAGERFAVRNSGANVVVEGVGDHGCEYMTGGNVVVLGATGRNFAAGMSGGIAYIYDLHNTFATGCNKEMVDIDPLSYDDVIFLHDRIEQHFNYTKSTVAKFILNDFENQLQYFVKVFPKDYKKVLEGKKLMEKA